MCAIVGRNLAVFDGSYTAVGGISALRGGQGACVLLALTIARRVNRCGPVEISGSVVTRFGLLVTQPGRDVTVARRQTGLPAADRRQLIGPGIGTVLRGLRAIFSRDLAVIDGSYPAIGGLCAPRVRPGTLVRLAAEIAGRAIPCRSVAIAGSVVTRLGLSVTQPGRNVTVARSEPGLPTADGRQLVGSGIFAILRRQRAIVGCNLAVVDGSYSAVRRISAPRIGSSAFVCRTPAIARCPIPCGSVELAGSVVACLGLAVTLLGGEVTRARSQPRRLAILRGLSAIFGCKPAVVDGLGAVIGSLGAPGGGVSAFVCRPPAIARGAVPGGSIEVTRRVIARLGLSVTELGRDITILSSQPRLPTARAQQFVGPGIFAVLGGLRTVFSRHLAVIDGLGAVVRSSGAPPGRLVTFVCRLLTVGRRAIPCGSIQIARRVITRLCLSVTQPGGGVAVLGSLAGLPAAHSSQLVGPGILAILGGLGAILGRHLAVVDRLGAVVRSLRAPRGNSGFFAWRPLTPTGSAVPSSSVEVTGRVVTRFGLSVTLLGLSVTNGRGQVAVASFCVALACRCQGAFAIIRPTGVLIWESHSARSSFGLMGRPCH